MRAYINGEIKNMTKYIYLTINANPTIIFDNINGNISILLLIVLAILTIVVLCIVKDKNL